jgi:ubiquinone/menaquinone biosynthesis C-methylase UbiE
MMKIKDFYNGVAENYEELVHSSQIKARLCDKLVELFSKHCITRGTILDVGCGPGILQPYLGKDFEYTGIDIADAMLNLAQKRNYQTMLGKMEDVLPDIKSKSHDYVVALSSLHFVKDINFILKEFERIARKGYVISLDNITDDYKQGFATIVEGSLYNHFYTKIENSTEDLTFPGWTSPRDNEVITVRMVMKSL